VGFLEIGADGRWIGMKWDGFVDEGGIGRNLGNE
jgi:hypothetical protein